MANEETTASKRPEVGSGWARSWPISSIRSSPAKRSRAASEHQLGGVQAHAGHRGPVGLQKGEQAAVAGPEVEDPAGAAGDLLEQHGLALGPMGELVGPGEVAVDVVRRLHSSEAISELLPEPVVGERLIVEGRHVYITRRAIHGDGFDEEAVGVQPSRGGAVAAGLSSSPPRRRRPVPSPRTDSATHIRLISETPPSRCLMPPQPTGSPWR